MREILKKSELEKLRLEYGNTPLLESALPLDPLKQFSFWFREARSANVMEANGMVLSTALPSGRVSSRMVLLKGLEKESFIFYTHYFSRKADQLSKNSYASLCFWWKEIYRQVLIEGKVEKISVSLAKNYYAKRPRGAQLATWASMQSTPLESREGLEDAFNYFKKKYKNKNVPMPPHWGGYRLIPDRYEFWQGRKDRLHDRILYVKANGEWVMSRLSP